VSAESCLQSNRGDPQFPESQTPQTCYRFPCRAILFDLDGVLVDSAECVERTWRNWASRHRLDPQHVIAFAHGRRTIETVRLAAPGLTPSRGRGTEL